MSEDKMEHQQDPKAASRRSRKDQQGRDYVCGCGKRYLSYPALYTHIKTKHHGQQPEGTQKTGVPPMNRRPKSNINDKLLKQIQTLVKIQNLNILTFLDENAQGSIPLNSRIRKQNLPKQFMQVYNSMLKSTGSIILDKKTPIQIILICYLIGVGQYCSQSMFIQYYCPFARYFRNCFRQYVQQVYDNCFKHEDVRKDRIINIQQCYLAPIICDFFLRFYIPYEKKQPDFQAVMDLISYDFCHWMYEHKLTIVEVTLKKNCQVRRNLIEPKKIQPKIQNEIEQQKQSEFENENQNQNQNQNQKEENYKQSQQQQHHSSMNQSQSEKEEQQQQQKQELMQNQKKQQNNIHAEQSNNQRNNQIVPQINNNKNDIAQSENKENNQ